MDEVTYGRTEPTRMIPFLTLSEMKPRAWITLSGCNFRCRGCFSIARSECGVPLTVRQLVRLLGSSSRRYYGTGPLAEVIITGGEPALSPAYLVELVSSLRSLTDRVVVQSNASLLPPALLDELMDSGMGELVCDIKAYDDAVHGWYTGCTNQDVLSNIRYASGRTRMVVGTLLMPGLVGEEEIVRVARFLADCRPMDLEYRICPFESRLSPEPVCRDPSQEELGQARAAAARALSGTVGSRSCLRDSDERPHATWVTVFPDGTMRRRGGDGYRAENETRYRGGRGGSGPG